MSRIVLIYKGTTVFAKAGVKNVCAYCGQESEENSTVIPHSSFCQLAVREEQRVPPGEPDPRD